MNKNDLIRAWKDPVYRSTLRDEELGALPAHPAGMIELRDDDLRGVGGALTTNFACTLHTFGNWQACGCPAG
ncbi:MAG TPA: mersacidin/lichenicidin family type 2 lantibiotic [Thermoanaerobaculia bacterium]